MINDDIVVISYVPKEADPTEVKVKMEKTLDQLKLEAEEERRRVYMERFGILPDKKEEDQRLSRFNN